MTENLLQFIWLHRLYQHDVALESMEKEKIVVIHPGRWNTDAGPDFLEAKIKIGETVWVGNLEIHLKSSDWIKHRHSDNRAYDKLILHVVYEHDVPVDSFLEERFPTLELKSYIDTELLRRYDRLMLFNSFIPCENLLETVPDLYKQQQLDRMLAERLENKTIVVTDLLQKTRNNWSEVFYILLSRGFGMHINQDVFEQLALRTPLSILIKHKHHPLQVEALLFGQAGFLNDYFDDAYPLLLQQEYLFLKTKYKLQAMPKHLWKFLRLRPANFPTIRIAEFAQLIVQSKNLFTAILNASSIKEMEKLFTVEVSGYWLQHYHFEQESNFRHKSIGRNFIDGLIINVIVPLLFIYGKMQGEPIYMDRAIRILEELPPERNHIIDRWLALNMPMHHAADTQALLQLKKNYCDYRKCTQCAIGYDLLKKKE